MAPRPPHRPRHADLGSRLTRVAKAVAYVVDGDRLLVLLHRDLPLLVTGVQVPAGTVRPGETPEEAVLREVREETGRDCFAVTRALGTAEYAIGPDVHERHFFALAPTAPLPEEWGAAEEHDGTRPPTAFTLRWIPLADGHVLAAGLGARLSALTGY